MGGLTNKIQFNNGNELFTKADNKLRSRDPLGSEWLYGFAISNRLVVSENNGDYISLKDAIDRANANATTNIEVLVTGGNHDIDDTITIDCAFPISLRGMGSSITFCEASTGLAGKPMFDLRSQFSVESIYFDGSTLASYGTLSNENCFSITTNSEIYYEFQNCIIDTFKIGIADLIGSDIRLFNFNIANCGKGYEVNYSTAAINSYTDIETGNFENCDIGIDLLKATEDNILIVHCAFFNIGAQIGIQYTGGAGNYELGDFSQILNCNRNRVGTFITGFDFARSDARDANVEISGCPNIAEKKPYGYFEVNDSTIVTTITTASTRTKLTWDAYDNTVVCKFGNPLINQVVYQSDNVHDMTMDVSVSFETDTGAPNEVQFCVAKNPTFNGNNEMTAYDEISGLTYVRADTNDNPYSCRILSHFEDVAKDDEFVLVGLQDSTDDLRIRRLTGEIRTL